MTWLDRARSYLDTAEIEGPHHNPKIVGLWKTARVPSIRDDETPWCAAFGSAAPDEAGMVSARTVWARSYLNWVARRTGRRLDRRVRAQLKAGHVGFVVSKDKAGNHMVLNGPFAAQLPQSAA